MLSKLINVRHRHIVFTILDLLSMMVKMLHLNILDMKIIKLRKAISKWEYRILASFAINHCKCPKCEELMKFNDIVYGDNGSNK